MSKKQWQNRIVGTAEVDPRQLAAHPLNHRIHTEYQKRIMTGALNEIGWIEHVTVNRRSGRMLNGHMRVALACHEGQPAVPVTYVELSPEEEAVALASCDAIGSLAVTDFEKLGENIAAITIENQGFNELFRDLREQTGMFTLAPTAAEAMGTGDSRDEQSRSGGDPKRQIKAVLYTDQVGVFERALTATGEKNRGEALLQICRTYLESHPYER